MKIKLKSLNPAKKIAIASSVRPDSKTMLPIWPKLTIKKNFKSQPTIIISNNYAGFFKEEKKRRSDKKWRQMEANVKKGRKSRRTMKQKKFIFFFKKRPNSTEKGELWRRVLETTAQHKTIG